MPRICFFLFSVNLSLSSLEVRRGIYITITVNGQQRSQKFYVQIIIRVINYSAFKRPTQFYFIIFIRVSSIHPPEMHLDGNDTDLGGTFFFLPLTMDQVTLFLLNTSDYVMRRRSSMNSGEREVTVSRVFSTATTKRGVHGWIDRFLLVLQRCTCEDEGRVSLTKYEAMCELGLTLVSRRKSRRNVNRINSEIIVEIFEKPESNTITERN